MKNKKLTILLPTLFLALSAASCTIKRPSQPSESQPESTQPGTSSEEEVAVTSVALNKNTLALEVGEEETLQHTVLPANASNTQVTWESDHPEFASVSNRGKVTAVAEGTAKITVKSVADATKFAECIVTVSPATGGRYGTEDHPKSIAEALAVAEEECTNDKDYTLQPVVAKGKLIANPSSYTEGVAYQFNLQDLADSSKKILVYSADATSAIYQNDEVTVKGYIQLYGTTIEFSNKGTDKVAVVNKVVGTSAITKVANGATITFDGDELTSAKNGTEFTFAVAAPAGKEIHKVLINNAQATPDNETHKYKGKVEGDTLIEVVVKNEGEDLKDASLYYNGTETVNMTAGNNAAAVNLDATFFNVESTNPTGIYAGLNKSGQIRLYNQYRTGEENPVGNGTKITVSVPSNSAIGSIKVIYDPATPGKDLEVKAGETTVTGEGDWYQINGTSFSLQNVSTATSSKQIYIKAINIYYVQGEDIVAESVEINEGAAMNVHQDSQVQLTAKLNPLGAIGDITWSSNSEKVTVGETTGLVTVAADAVVGSKATITATSGTLTDSIELTILEKLNYGTAAEPISVNQVKALMDEFGSGNITEEVYFKGYVFCHEAKSQYNSKDQYKEAWLTDNDGTVAKAFELYGVNFDGDFADVASSYTAADSLYGKQVTVHVESKGLKIYKGTYETDSGKAQIIAVEEGTRVATDAELFIDGEKLTEPKELKRGFKSQITYNLLPYASKTTETAAWSITAGSDGDRVSISNKGLVSTAADTTLDTMVSVRLTLGSIVKDLENAYKIVKGVTASVVEAPAASTKYKVGICTAGETTNPRKYTSDYYYFTGKIVSYKLELTDNPDEAVDAEAIAVTGGYKIKFTDKSNKVTYLKMYVSGNNNNFSFPEAEADGSVFTYDSTAKTLIIELNGHTTSSKDGNYFVGSYNGYLTAGPSLTSFITGDNAGNVDKTQFVLHFINVVPEA